jgi:DNA-binding NarL/FixJ family response regulator
MAQIRVLLADDFKDFRLIVRKFLDKIPHVAVVGEAADGIEAVDKVELLQPDVVVMDITMPNRNGIQAAKIIKERWPATKIMIATMHDNPIYREQAKAVNVDRFIVKSCMKPELEAIFQDRRAWDAFCFVTEEQRVMLQ